jgi:hypothetical protein
MGGAKKGQGSITISRGGLLRWVIWIYFFYLPSQYSLATTNVLRSGGEGAVEVVWEWGNWICWVDVDKTTCWDNFYGVLEYRTRVGLEWASWSSVVTRHFGIDVSVTIWHNTRTKWGHCASKHQLWFWCNCNLTLLVRISLFVSGLDLSFVISSPVRCSKQSPKHYSLLLCFFTLCVQYSIQTGDLLIAAAADNDLRFKWFSGLSIKLKLNILTALQQLHEAFTRVLI